MPASALKGLPEAPLPGLLSLLLIYWVTERVGVPLSPHLRVTEDGVQWQGGAFKPSQFRMVGSPDDGRIRVMADAVTLLDHRPTREGPGSPHDLADLCERIQHRLAIPLHDSRPSRAWDLWPQNDDLNSAGDVRSWVAHSKRTCPGAWAQPLIDVGTYTHDGVRFQFRQRFELSKTTLRVSGVEIPLADLFEVHSYHWGVGTRYASAVLLVHRSGKIDKIMVGSRRKPGAVRHAVARIQTALQAFVPAEGGTAQDVPDSLRQMRAKESG